MKIRAKQSESFRMAIQAIQRAQDSMHQLEKESVERSMYYILKDGQPVPATVHEWAAWCESDADFSQRRVAVTQIGEVEISTVFLGLDHQFLLEGEPVLFETLVFRGKLDGELERYSTVEEARTGHERMVERVKTAEAGE